MAVKSLAQSSLSKPQRHRSMLAGYETNMFHHLETIRLGSSAASVEFTNLGQYSDFQHLQIRVLSRSNRSGTVDILNMRFNGISTASYSTHQLVSNGSSITSSQGSGGGTYMLTLRGNGNTETANAFGSGVVDILDPFETTKNTTIRTLSGTSTEVWLTSGAFLSTTAVSSMELYPDAGSVVLAGSRFSLYGLKARA